MLEVHQTRCSDGSRPSDGGKYGRHLAAHVNSLVGTSEAGVLPSEAGVTQMDTQGEDQASSAWIAIDRR